MVKPLRKKVVFTALVLGLVLLGFEAALRMAGYQPNFSQNGLTAQLDQELLFSIKPNCRADINQLGLRNREMQEHLPGTYRILVQGDSFVMGLNVTHTDALPQQLERRLGKFYETVNMGVCGYGPDQSYKQLLKTGLTLNPDMVVLCLFAANDFNDLIKNQLFAITPKGLLVENKQNAVNQALPTTKLGLLTNRLFHKGALPKAPQEKLLAHLFGDPLTLIENPNHPKHKQSINLMKALLAKYQTTTKRHHLPFLVVILPCFENIQDSRYFKNNGIAPKDYFNNENLLVQICQELEITYLDLREPLKSAADLHPYDPQDHHFSVMGNKISAQAIGERILEIRSKFTR